MVQNMSKFEYFWDIIRMISVVSCILWLQTQLSPVSISVPSLDWPVNCTNQNVNMHVKIRLIKVIAIFLLYMMCHFGCSQQSAAVNNRLQSTIGCSQQSAAVNNRLQSTIGCSQQSAAVNNRLQSTIGCSQQSAAVNNRLQSTIGCSQQSDAVNNRLCTVNNRLQPPIDWGQSTIGCSQQSVAVDNRLQPTIGCSQQSAVDSQQSAAVNNRLQSTIGCSDNQLLYFQIYASSHCYFAHSNNNWHTGRR